MVLTRGLMPTTLSRTRSRSCARPFWLWPPMRCAPEPRNWRRAGRISTGGTVFFRIWTFQVRIIQVELIQIWRRRKITSTHIRRYAAPNLRSLQQQRAGTGADHESPHAGPSQRLGRQCAIGRSAIHSDSGRAGRYLRRSCTRLFPASPTRSISTFCRAWS